MEQNKKFNELIIQDEISLVVLWKSITKIIKSLKIYFLIITSIILIISIIQYKYTPEEYEGKVNVIIEQSSSNNLNGLSSLLVISQNTNSGSLVMGPDMYKDIIESQAFLNELVTTKIPISEKKDSMTLEEYFINGENKNLIEKINDNILVFNNKKSQNINNIKFNQNSLIQNNITPEMIFSTKVPPIIEIQGARANAIEIMKQRIKISFKDRYCTITTTMPKPILSAIICKVTLEKLITYVTFYKTTKQRQNISFLEARYNEAEIKYKNAQLKSATYQDNNLGIMLQSAHTREQILNNELSITFNIFNQFATQLEQAKIDLKKETPLFSIIEPINVNWNKTKPNFINIIIKNLFYIFLLSLIVIAIKIMKNKTI